MTIMSPEGPQETPSSRGSNRLDVRIVSLRPALVLSVLGITVLLGLVLLLGYLAWQVLSWILIAIVLASALNPAVAAFERRGLGRASSAAIVFGMTLFAMGTVGFLIGPPLVSQVGEFVEAVPDFVDDLTKGRGPLGFLQDEYQIVDRIREAIEKQGPGGVLGFGEPLLDVLRSVVTVVVATLTIVFLTFFMLLEGPKTIERLLDLLAPTTRLRWERVGYDIYKTISGYVTGNLLISLIAGVTSTVVLFVAGSDFAIALGLLVAILDLIPLAGATIAAIVVSTVVFIETDWVRGLIVAGFFLGYQQLENHLIQPLVYGRTVQLSPLVVLCAVLIGASLAGIFGALFAIPIAGSLLAIGRELLLVKRDAAIEAPPGVDLVLEGRADQD
ncbi:MAG: AI-2E family transporter [Actinobacteria bacterium]|nr:AI-2E family transporter [Actinomycetota bacterium]